MKKTLALLCSLLLLFTLLLSSCKKETPLPGDTGHGSVTNSPNDESAPAKPDATLPVTVWTLNGTTGFGMAKLMDNAKNHTAALNYTFSVKTDATYIRDSIINGKGEGGECPDIAAVPTNVAAALYNATNGGVRILAINTAGVLYLVTTNGQTPASLSELTGKTVYCPAQNPAFIVKALLQKENLADRITLNTTDYADPTELRTAVANGLVEYAILPEPMVTIAGKANARMKVAVDITAEWNQYFPANSLVQGCVIARTEFVNEHPAEVKKFLEEYKASIEYVKANPDAAGTMIADNGIFAQAPVAKLAIPKCNLCYLSGEEMKAAMKAFLAEMPAASIGGKLPGDDFYFGA